MVYILIVIVLFAAIGFALSRQSDTAEQGTVERSQASISATQLQETAMQIKQAIDQMLYTGSTIDGLLFTPPSDPGFDNPPRIHKVFHPDGGGIILPRLATNSTTQNITDPAPGWYLGRFNNVEWTRGTGNDVILTAYGIPEAACEQLNRALTGSTAIPEMADPAVQLVPASGNHSRANAAFTAATCGDCVEMLSLCVKQTGQNVWVFYNILAQQ